MRRGRRAANVLRVQHQLTPQLLQTKPHSTRLISEDPSFASLLGPFLPLKQQRRRQRPNKQALRPPAPLPGDPTSHSLPTSAHLTKHCRVDDNMSKIRGKSPSLWNLCERISCNPCAACPASGCQARPKSVFVSLDAEGEVPPLGRNGRSRPISCVGSVSFRLGSPWSLRRWPIAALEFVRGASMKLKTTRRVGVRAVRGNLRLGVADSWVLASDE